MRQGTVFMLDSSGSLISEERQVSVFLSTVETKDKKQLWFTIRDLAHEFGVTLRALRFYEDKGLLNPRREGLNRFYSRRDRVRLQVVMACKRLGFSLVEIKGVVDLCDGRGGRVHNLKELLGRLREQLVVLEGQKQSLELGLTELTDHIEQISDVLEECSPKMA